MTVSSINANIVSTISSSTATAKVGATPPSGGKIGFSAEKSAPDGKIGFVPPSDGKIGGTVDIKA